MEVYCGEEYHNMTRRSKRILMRLLSFFRLYVRFWAKMYIFVVWSA